MKFFSLRLWPNGEFGIGAIGRFNLSKKLPPVVPQYPDRVSWTASEVFKWATVMLAQGHSLKWVLGSMCPLHRATLERSNPLGSSNASNSVTRSARGSGGLTSYARRMLRNGCFLLARKAGTRNVALLTATFPEMDEDVMKDVTIHWSKIIQVFCKWLHRRLDAAGGCPWVIGCIEIQEERIEKYGGLPLHLHVVFQAKNGKEFTIDKDEVKIAWKRAVCSHVPEAEPYDWQPSTRIEGVRKSVENYLSKYMSKGITDNVVRNLEKGYKLPSAWWIGFGTFKKEIAKEMIYEAGEIASSVWWLSHNRKDFFRYVFPVFIKRGRVEVCVGIAGRMPKAMWEACNCGDLASIQALQAA